MTHGAATQLALARRVFALEALFVQIAATRMADVPVLHPGLSVRAEGFEAESDGLVATGVLVTPWFMNLVRLPLSGEAPMAAHGVMRARRVGSTSLDFIGAHEPDFGPYEACSLFSPMFEFADQDAAMATARAVLQALRQAVPPQAPQAARRALLFGRPAQGASR